MFRCSTNSPFLLRDLQVGHVEDPWRTYSNMLAFPGLVETRQGLDSMVEADQEIEDFSHVALETEDMSKMEELEWCGKNAENSWEGTRDPIKFSEKL